MPGVLVVAFVARVLVMAPLVRVLVMAAVVRVLVMAAGAVPFVHVVRCVAGVTQPTHSLLGDRGGVASRWSVVGGLMSVVVVVHLDPP